MVVAPLHLTADSGPAACTYRAVRGPGGPKNSSAVFLRNPGPLGPLCVSLQFYSKNAVPRLGPPWTTWTTFGGRDLTSLGCQGLRRFFFSSPAERDGTGRNGFCAWFGIHSRTCLRVLAALRACGASSELGFAKQTLLRCSALVDPLRVFTDCVFGGLRDASKTLRF